METTSYKVILTSYISDDHIFVGMTHGCEIERYIEFYLDGKKFDPTTSTGAIEGEQFKVIVMSDMYKPDKQATLDLLEHTGSTVAAEPLEVRSRRVGEMTLERNNRIKRVQKLNVLKDGVTFYVLYGAMQRTFQEFINGPVIVNDRNGTRNYFPGELNDPQPLPPSTERLGWDISDASFATKFTATGEHGGYSYEISTWCANADTSKLD